MGVGDVDIVIYGSLQLGFGYVPGMVRVQCKRGDIAGLEKLRLLALKDARHDPFQGRFMISRKIFKTQPNSFFSQ